MMKNDFGQLQAKLNLNIEAEPAPPPAAAGGAAPTFVEKPKIVTKEEGKLIMLIVKYRAEAQCTTVWSYKESQVVESKTVRMVHERVADYWESRLELMVDGIGVQTLRSQCMVFKPFDPDAWCTFSPLRIPNAWCPFHPCGPPMHGVPFHH